ncbi:MAG: DUF116 domain-containing protein [Methanoregula sp.]|jgi:hypothetical protein
MEFDPGPWHNLIFIIGEATILIIIGALLVSFVLVVISLYSIRRGRLYFPRLIRTGIILLEGNMKAFFRLLGLEEREMLNFVIKIHNTMNTSTFSQVPVEHRAVFLPQCLRSAKCPAHLTPEGLKCMNCKQCTVGEAQILLEKLGYRIFIVPGSSFITRMVKKYHPKALIGVGCLSEVKEGLDMADKIGLISMGVVTLKEGCVETLVDWQDLYEVAVLGLDPASVPEDLHVLAG